MKKFWRKLISHIPGRILSRAALFAFSWYFMPTFIFWLIAIGVYMVPVFRTFHVLVPYIGILILSAIVPHTVFYILVLGALVYLALGIKDIAFLERAELYETLCALILLVGANELFQTNDSFRAPAVAILAGFGFFFLGRSMLDYHEDDGPSVYQKLAMVRIGNGVSALIFAEAAAVILLLPISPAFQTAIAFLVGTIFLEILRGYAQSGISRKSILTMSAIFLAVVVIIFTANPWGL